MAKQTFTINSVLAGWGTSDYFYQQGQFSNSIGIDPEMPKDDLTTRPSGLLRPTSMAKFSGTEITGAPLWIETNNKDTNAHVYTYDGKVHTVSSGLTMGTALNSGNALTTASGNGLAYYNNYLYGASNTDIWRYGPLNGTPALTQNFWTSTLALTALSNYTYPSIKGIKIPNHAMFVHPSNSRLYFCDMNSDNVGMISMIKTKKVTYEGDTNDTVVPSAYKVLDTYYGWLPTCLSNLGNEIAMGLIDGSSATVKQGNAKVVFWDLLASSTSYSRIAELPDPLITAMKTVNGQLYVFSGSASGGMRVSRYLGGQQFEEIYYADDQVPPFQGAVDYMINRIVFGCSTTTPATSASVMALGSRVRNLNMGVHNILKSTSAGATPLVTACKYITQGSNTQPIVGFSDGSSKGLDKISTTYGTSIWRSQIFSLGRNGKIEKIRIPFANAVGANMTLTVKMYADDLSSNVTLGTITNSTHSGAREVVLYGQASNFKNNFLIELTWSGTALLTVSFPIEIIVEYNQEF